MALTQLACAPYICFTPPDWQEISMTRDEREGLRTKRERDLIRMKDETNKRDKRIMAEEGEVKQGAFWVNAMITQSSSGKTVIRQCKSQ